MSEKYFDEWDELSQITGEVMSAMDRAWTLGETLHCRSVYLKHLVEDLLDSRPPVATADLLDPRPPVATAKFSKIRFELRSYLPHPPHSGEEDIYYVVIYRFEKRRRKEERWFRPVRIESIEDWIEFEKPHDDLMNKLGLLGIEYEQIVRRFGKAVEEHVG